MESFEVEFPVWVIASVKDENSRSGTFVKFDAPGHKSCFPIFTDMDRAEGFKETSVTAGRVSRVITVDNKAVLKNLLTALKQRGCNYVTRDYYFGQLHTKGKKSATATYYTIQHIIAWCSEISDQETITMPSDRRS